MSASVPASGCGGPVLGMLVLFAALGALYTYWQYVLGVIGGLAVVLLIIGLARQGPKAGPRASRDGVPYFGAAGPDDARNVAELNTRPAHVRASLRQQCLTGQLPCIPGYHWAAGDVLERDTGPQAAVSDRR